MAKETQQSYWIGVASHDHVRSAVKGGFSQVSHGKEALLRRMKTGDIIIYYSPRESMDSGAALQSFTAAGRILDDVPYQVEQSANFRPFRRRTKFFECKQAPIRPLLQDLTFTRGRASWGTAFRSGSFRITRQDFQAIAKAMFIAPMVKLRPESDDSHQSS